MQYIKQLILMLQFTLYSCDHLQLIGATKSYRRSDFVWIFYRSNQPQRPRKRCSSRTPDASVLPLILKMVNATKGMFIACDIPMAQLIVNYNASLPASQKFIIHVLDSTHLFVQPYAIDMIKSHISEFRDKISYEKPT